MSDMATGANSASVSTWMDLQTTLYSADIDGNGVVDQTELETLISSDSSVADQIVSQADNDNDGAASLSEFSSFSDRFSAATEAWRRFPRRKPAMPRPSFSRIWS